MLATAPTFHNRIAGHFAPAPIPVPATPEGKQAAWGDAVFAAALFLQARLRHPDPNVAERAAFALIDLEKNRLRHGRDLAGAAAPEPVNPDPLPPLPEPSPINGTTRSSGPRHAVAPKPVSDKAKANTIARSKECRPILDVMSAELVVNGVEGKEARDFAFAVLKKEVLDILRDRHERNLAKPVVNTDIVIAEGEPLLGERRDVSPPVDEIAEHRRTDVAPFA